MGKVGDKGFAGGWQNKSVSKKLSESRTESAQKSMKQASKVVEKLVRAKVQNQAKVKPQTATNQAKAKPVVKPGKDVPQTIQKSRPETQDQAARMSPEASSKFTKNSKPDSQQMLKNLQQAKTPATKSGTKAATKSAVVQKGSTDQPNLGKQDVKQPVANLVRNADVHAQKDAARQNAAEHLKTAERAKKGKGEKPVADNAKLAQSKVAKDAAAQPKVQVNIEGKTPKSKFEKSEKKKTADSEKKTDKRDGSKKSSSMTRSAGSDKSKELNAMLSGFAGSNSEEVDAQDEAPSAVAKSDKPEALPEKDPSFHVFSEFDEANPGVEEVKAKSQVFDRLVAKKTRLKEIAELDKELEGKIQDMFKDTPLSERIVGDLKEEIKLAKFLGSVYGGVCG